MTGLNESQDTLYIVDVFASFSIQVNYILSSDGN